MPEPYQRSDGASITDSVSLAEYKPTEIVDTNRNHDSDSNDVNSLRLARSKEEQDLDNLITRTRTEQLIISVLSRRADKAMSRLNINVEENKVHRDSLSIATADDVEKRLQDTKNDSSSDASGPHKVGNEDNQDYDYYKEDDTLELPTKKDGTEFRSINPDLVTWNGEEDPEHPRNWPAKKRWQATVLVATYAMVSPFSSSICSPSASSIAKEFGIINLCVQAMITSIFVLGYALLPLIVSPISEFYGRRVVLTAAAWTLFFFNIGCALSRNTAQILVFRFIAGGAGSVPLCVGAGVIGDLFAPRERGLANTVFSCGPALGPALSPLIAGFVEQYLGWRWNFWIMSMITGVVAVIGLVLYPETYSPILLKWKCRKLRKETGNQNLRTIYDIADGSTVFQRLYVALALPFKFLFIHPMIYGLGIFQAFLYGLFYLLLIAFPSIYGKTYHMSQGIQGLMFISFGVGYSLGILIWSQVNERSYKKLIKKNNGVPEPEFRLESLTFIAVTCSLSILIFGWTSQEKVHWIVPTIFAAIFAFAYLNNFLTIIVYAIDMNPRFAASACLALAFLRSVFGFVFPLFSPKMFSSLGYGWACTIFCFLMLILGIPFPMFVFKRGKSLRLWANRVFERDQAERDKKNLARLKKQNELKLQQQEQRLQRVKTKEE